jgi:hypothetical protein
MTSTQRANGGGYANTRLQRAVGTVVTLRNASNIYYTNYTHHYHIYITKYRRTAVPMNHRTSVKQYHSIIIQ